MTHVIEKENQQLTFVKSDSLDFRLNEFFELDALFALLENLGHLPAGHFTSAQSNSSEKGQQASPH
jgi:hypothetical protein